MGSVVLHAENHSQIPVTIVIINGFIQMGSRTLVLRLERYSVLPHSDMTHTVVLHYEHEACLPLPQTFMQRSGVKLYR